MPTPIWEAELSFDGFAYTPTPVVSSNPADANWWWGGLEAVCLPILDPLPQFNPLTDVGNFGLFVGFNDRTDFVLGAPGAFQFITFRFGDVVIAPPQWTGTFLTPAISGADPALLVAGGTLSITKDYDGDLMTFTGPLGTQTVALTALDALPGGPFGYYNNTPLRPRGYAHRLHLQIPTFSNPAFTVDDTFSWYNLIGKQNGVAYQTVALSTGDPGTWWPINNRDFVPGTGTVDEGLAPWWTYSQLASRQKVEGNVLAASYPDWTDSITWKRLRDVSVLSLDLVTAPEHGMIFGAYSPPPSLTGVVLRRSYDQAESWTDTFVVSDSDVHGSISTQWFAGVIHVLYEDISTGVIYQAHSRDTGQTWTGPVSVSITGTCPRLLISPEGLFFYFYCDAGDLKLQRSDDFGGSTFGSPITVQTSVPAQDIGATFSVDGSIVVSYVDGSNNWQSLRSRDLGLTWSVI